MTDVFVIGGGPVGLAAAIAARRKGFRVVLADARTPPIDKACGEGILPDGIAAAAGLGVDLRAVESHPIRGIRFHGEGVSVAADFPNESARGIRRTALHGALVEAAERAGVELRWGCSVSSLDPIEADWIIGADGMASRVRAWAGLEAFERDSRRYGFRVHYRLPPWSDYVEVHWGDGFQVYITPISPEQTSVALLCRDPAMRVREVVKLFPDIAERLCGISEASQERGGLTATRRLRRVTSGHIALIGDASGSVDAISGEGLCLGFRQAAALADAIERRNLKLYESVHRRLARRPRFMADLMLAMNDAPWLRRRGMPALATRPELLKGLLAMHVGEARKADFAANCLSLGWRMLTS